LEIVENFVYSLEEGSDKEYPGDSIKREIPVSDVYLQLPPIWFGKSNG
jgi:hypothetical protein